MTGCVAASGRVRARSRKQRGRIPSLICRRQGDARGRRSHQKHATRRKSLRGYAGRVRASCLWRHVASRKQGGAPGWTWRGMFRALDAPSLRDVRTARGDRPPDLPDGCHHITDSDETATLAACRATEPMVKDIVFAQPCGRRRHDPAFPRAMRRQFKSGAIRIVSTLDTKAALLRSLDYQPGLFSRARAGNELSHRSNWRASCRISRRGWGGWPVAEVDFHSTERHLRCAAPGGVETVRWITRKFPGADCDPPFGGTTAIAMTRPNEADGG